MKLLLLAHYGDCFDILQTFAPQRAIIVKSENLNTFDATFRSQIERT